MLIFSSADLHGLICILRILEGMRDSYLLSLNISKTNQSLLVFVENLRLRVVLQKFFSWAPEYVHGTRGHFEYLANNLL